MDDHESARILAYAEVLRERQRRDYSLRYIFRWFSEKFSTPYADVEEMPVDDVLRHFYEVEAEQAVAAASEDGQAGFQARQDLAKTLRELSMSPQERAKMVAEQQRKEAVLGEKDEEFDRQVEAEARAQEAEREKQEREKGEATPPPAATESEELPPIKMEFGLPHELEELGAGDGLGLVGLEKP